MSFPYKHNESDAILSLMSMAGISGQIKEIRTVRSGANNRAYCVEFLDKRLFVKQYFQSSDDARDRLSVEYDFLTYAKEVAPHFVPKPLAQDAERGMVLYEYITGEPVSCGEVGETEVAAAINFFVALNEPSFRENAVTLPEASDSAFSLSQHLMSVERRIEQLLLVEGRGDIERQGVIFIREISRFWDKCKENVALKAKQHGWKLSTPLPQHKRCISPSDFGFHNALRMQNGEVRFIDFEYAGWDDPAKMVVDFFLQPAVPVPKDYFDHFFSSALRGFDGVDTLMLRIRLLYPVHVIKWCCIALNVFQPVHMSRRKFSSPHLDEQALMIEQLAIAKQIFKTVKDSDYGLC